jgi:hypothetical protein
MSYQEKNVTVSLVSHLLIGGYYLFNIFQMLQDGGLVAQRLFNLWAVTVIATILVVIVGSILANVLSSILYAIRNNGREPGDQQFIEDERDKLFDLKGDRVSYITFALGVLAAMLTFVFGQPPLVMFSLIIFFSILAQVFGDIAKISLYRSGG